MTAQPSHRSEALAGPVAAVHAPLVAVLERLGAALGELDALSRRQASLIDAEDPEPLLSLIAGREEAGRRLAAAVRDLDPLRREWERCRPEAPATARSEIDASLNALAGAAAAIMQRDEADGAALARRREELMVALGGVDRSRSAVGAYRGAAPTGPSIQDTEA